MSNQSNSILEISALILSVIALFVSVFWNWYLKKWHFRTQYKLENINEIYPRLLSDIKDCKKSYYNFLDHGKGPINNIDALRTIIDNGRIEFINSIDKELYDALMNVKNDVLPKIKELEYERTKKFEIIKERWVKYLEDIPFHTGFGHKNFAHVLHSMSTSFYIKGNYNVIRQKYNELLDEKLEGNNEFKRFPEETPDKLIDIVKEETSELHELIQKINILFNEIINKKIIPIMERKIGNPI